MEFQDYYKILGVERSATADQVKTAYRRLARKFHPDVSKETNAEARFKEVQEAYEVLKDPEKRAAYDQLGSEWKSGQQFRPPPDWGSGFEFSGGAGRAGRARDHHARVDITLEEAYHGTTRTLELRRPELTAEGHVELSTHTVRVNIPAGVTEGQLVRLAGQGEPAAGNRPAGDLYLEVHVSPNALYQVDGRNVTLTFPVAPWEAALGSQVTVPTLGGAVQMTIPAGAQSGQKLRLRGRGLPGQPPGDQYVQLKVVLPAADSAEARALYEQMRAKLAFDPRADLTR
jgi:curved DNA-binding protein